LFHDRKGFARIYELLKPGGYFVASVLKDHEIFDAYCKAAVNEEYSKYLYDLPLILPQLYHDSNAHQTTGKMLEEVGFKITSFELKNDVFDYETKLNYKSEFSICF
jgi:hypothetical protein